MCLLLYSVAYYVPTTPHKAQTHPRGRDIIYKTTIRIINRSVKVWRHEFQKKKSFILLVDNTYQFDVNPYIVIKHCLTVEEVVTISYGQTPIDGIKHTISRVHAVRK